MLFLSNLTHFFSIIQRNSHGRYGKEKAEELRQIARNSIGSNSPSLAFELQQTIQTIIFLQEQIAALDKEINKQVVALNSPLISIPGISYVLAGIIISEIGDISRFDTPAKLLAFAGLEPSTFQSGNFCSDHAAMVKRGSKYLRWALLTATRLVCMRDEVFRSYRDRKLHEGKHYFVALSHTSKKLTRVIFHMLKSNQAFTLRAS